MPRTVSSARGQQERRSCRAVADEHDDVDATLGGPVGGDADGSGDDAEVGRVDNRADPSIFRGHRTYSGDVLSALPVI